MRTAQLGVGMRPLLLTIFLAILAMVLACGGGDEAASGAAPERRDCLRRHARSGPRDRPRGLRPGAGHVHCGAGPHRADLLAAGARRPGGSGRGAAAGARGAVGGRRGRQVDHVPPSAGGPVARRPALHRGRRGLPLQPRHLPAEGPVLQPARALPGRRRHPGAGRLDGGLPHGTPERGAPSQLRGRALHGGGQARDGAGDGGGPARASEQPGGARRHGAIHLRRVPAGQQLPRGEEPQLLGRGQALP